MSGSQNSVHGVSSRPVHVEAPATAGASWPAGGGNAPRRSFSDAAADRLRDVASAIMCDEAQPGEIVDAAASVAVEAVGLDDAAAGLLALLMRAEAMDDALKARAAVIASERAHVQRAIAQARDALMACIEDTGMPQIEGAHHIAAVAATPKAVVVTDIDALPEQFRRVKVEPDKAAISAALKAGQTVPGATLTNGGATLRIQPRKKDTIR